MPRRTGRDELARHEDGRMSTMVPIASTPLTRERMLETFVDGCKPREQWRIGTEHEKLALDGKTGKQLPYRGAPGILTLLEYLAENFGWAPYYEDGRIIALTRGHASITLEPGGQFELSGTAWSTIHETRQELDQHLVELEALTDAFGVRWSWVGLNPTQRLDEIDWMPKDRYAIMRSYLATRGRSYDRMMKLTCTVQANVDYSNKADAARKMRTSMALSPVVTALFANSPLEAGRPTGYLSTRQQVWTEVDPDRCGILPFVFEGPFGFEDYATWAMKVPMFFIHRDGRYVDISGLPFEKFFKEGYGPYHATEADWELHLSTLFPETRLKRYLELRSADCVPPALIPALPALWKGILYDNEAMNAAWLLASELSLRERVALLSSAARSALKSTIGGRPMREVAGQLVEIAAAGLRRQACLDAQGRDESIYLEPLREIVERGEPPAIDLLRREGFDPGA
jgi:glutamate--cysteine ligase